MPSGGARRVGRPPPGMTFQREMDPRISGGTIVDVSSEEFRALLSLIISPAPSSIYFSGPRVQSMLISGPILFDPTCVSRRQIPRDAFAYMEDNAFSRLEEPCI